MKLALPVALVLGVVSCSAPESADQTLPWTTTVTTVADTVVASTTGDVPERLVHQLVVDWHASGDTVASELFGEVSSIAVGADGTVWVWDGATPVLFQFDANGKLVRRVSRRGSGPGEYQRVNDIAVARDNALVMWDEGNARVNIYNPDGSFRTSFTLTFSDCCGLPVMVDDQGRIWLQTHPKMIGGKEKGFDPADFGKPQDVGYYRYDSVGSLIDTVFAPVLPGVDGVVTALTVTRSSMGGRAQHVPYGTYPLYATSPLGHVVTALARPYAVHTRANGKPVRITREYTPPEISDDERAQQRANIEFQMREAKADFTWNGPEIPRQKPPIQDLLVGLDGRIWVQLSVESEEFDPGQSAGDPSRPGRGGRGAAPPIRFRPKEKRWDVYEPDGRYLGRVLTPRTFSLYVARGSQLWGTIRDEDDLPTLVRMRIEPKLP